MCGGNRGEEMNCPRLCDQWLRLLLVLAVKIVSRCRVASRPVSMNGHGWLT